MALSILNVHTPTSSFAILHSITRESLTDLFDKLSRKTHADYQDQRVGPGWLKYEHDESIWNLDDESDYMIFVWRQQRYLTIGNETSTPSIAIGEPGPSRPSQTIPQTTTMPTPTLHLHDPSQPLPIPPAYRNPSYCAFRLAPTLKVSPAPSSNGKSSRRSARESLKDKNEGKDRVPKLMKQFEKFHSENGVRTVIGSIGPVQNVRMLLKSGYRHVYISRKFAQKHGFIPPDATPGNYGYGGLVNIGLWPITLMTSSSEELSSPPDHDAAEGAGIGEHGSLLRPPARAGAIGLGIGGAGRGHGGRSSGSIRRSTSKSSRNSAGGVLPLLDGATTDSGKKALQPTEGRARPKVTEIQVYLSEEPHFDVVLGRSFFEKRQIKTSAIDLTDVVCMDTGEKIECEVVILKDGKGEIVTVT